MHDGGATPHPEPEVLERFVAGELPEAETREVLRHLLTRCPSCRLATAPLWDTEGGEPRLRGFRVAPPLPREPDLPAPDEAPMSVVEAARKPGKPGDAYDEVFDRIFERVSVKEAEIARERVKGRELFQELMGHPPARRLMLVANSSRFRNGMLCEQLIAEAHGAGFNDPARSAETARLAVVVAEQLAPESCGSVEITNGLRARAWGQLGNALRIHADLPAAERAIAKAIALLDDTRSVGLLDKARVLDLLSSLRKEQRRYDEAEKLLDRVIVIYRKLGQRNLLGRAYNQKANVCGEAGDAGRRLGLLRRAAELVDRGEDPRMFLTVRHNLILALTENGRAREASSLLFHTRPLYLKMGDRMNLLRLRWLEGTVANALDRHDQAEQAFREVLDAFLEVGLPFDAALAALDLAIVLAVQGRTREVRELAGEILAVFQANDLHQEATAALVMLYRAAEMEKAEVTLMRDLAAYLQQARNNPALRFARD
jgi:tetratricopeptide (TPR) repeat protein